MYLWHTQIKVRLSTQSNGMNHEAEIKKETDLLNEECGVLGWDKIVSKLRVLHAEP